MEKSKLIQLIESEIEATKQDDEYQNDDNENLIFEELSKVYELTEDDDEYMLKATNTERLELALSKLK